MSKLTLNLPKEHWSEEQIEERLIEDCTMRKLNEVRLLSRPQIKFIDNFIVVSVFFLVHEPF